MSIVDWVVLFGTVLGIVFYGVWVGKRNNNLNTYIRGGDDLKWGTIGLSVMATQASAITFLSTPGQGYEEGLAFVQNYLGLPIALVIICLFFIPLYYKLNVSTAYELLGQRFDQKTRLLGAGLFLVQRGFAAGITIYAPAIIVSTLFGWGLNTTILVTGILVILYTVSGGTRTVSLTQKYQMLVIIVGMTIAFGYIIAGLPDDISLGDAFYLAGIQGRMEAISFSLNPEERYTIWTGLLGGTFLALSYFGTDQSQVQRYLAGRSSVASRLGLMFNAVFKIPMQFAILLLGALLFVFYQFAGSPVFFNEAALDGIPEERLEQIEAEYAAGQQTRIPLLREILIEKAESGEPSADTLGYLVGVNAELEKQRVAVQEEIKRVNASADTEDADYVFLSFVLDNLPVGLVGLLVAVIFLAAMSSTASELNALASTTMVDGYRALIKRDESETHYVWIARGLTLFWGILAIGFAMTLTLFDNLIEAVNIIGSLFYGAILGLFLIAFFIRWVKGSAAFWGGVIAEILVLALFFSEIDIGYLWFNMIGCVITVIFSIVFQQVFFGGLKEAK
ncbi:MAG: sodium:solute symporter [Verrucomicrobiota bacterium]